MNATRLPVIFLILLMVTSCEKDFVMPAGEVKMNVNCKLDNERIVSVFVTESVSPYGGGTLKPITDAVVELFKNDSLLQTLRFVYTNSDSSFGSYQYPYFPEAGNKYSVRVTHPKYGVVTAADTLPLLPAVSSYQLVHYGTESNNYTSQFKFQFQDDGISEDFYRLNIWEWGKSVSYHIDSTGDTTYNDFGFSYRPWNETALNDTVIDWKSILFSDKGFNGQMKEFNLNFESPPSDYIRSGYVTLEFCRISRANYDYFRTLEIYHNRTEDSEPVKVMCNITNGYGTFMSEAIFQMTTQVK